MKNKHLYLPLLIIFLVLLIDQWVKFYIKLHFSLGEEVKVMGDWFRLHFTENYGMAFGIELGGIWGKILLTIFRIIFVGIIGYYISTLIKGKRHLGYILSWSLILAGALGNIIDSVFYGKIFSESLHGGPLAEFMPALGYDGWFRGRVVDMLYFPLIQTTIPDNFPIWAGEDFEFFRPVFNIADSAISIGFVCILIFSNAFSKQEQTLLADENNPSS